LNNLICPISKENQILENQKVDKNGLVVAGTSPLAPQLKDYINENHLSNLELVGYKSGIIILPESWTRGLVKKSLNLTKRYDQTNPTQIHA
jgi:hypothetical protein